MDHLFLTLSLVRLKYSSGPPRVSFFNATVIWERFQGWLFPWWRVMHVTWHSMADNWISFVSFFLFYLKYSQTCLPCHEQSNILIHKYVLIMSVFCHLKTFINDLDHDLWDGRHHVCSRRSSESPVNRIYSTWIHQFLPKYMLVSGQWAGRRTKWTLSLWLRYCHVHTASFRSDNCI